MNGRGNSGRFPKGQPLIACLAAAVVCVPMPSPAPPPPFQNFRERILEASGDSQATGFPESLTEIRLGWFGPSDPRDPEFGPRWWAARHAVAQANASGGLQGTPFRLVPRWSDQPWGNGAALVTRLVYEDGVGAILGSIDGATTHLAEQVVAKARLPLISPVASDSSINLAGVPWMFSCAPGDHHVAPLLARMAKESLPSPPAMLTLISAIDHDSRATASEVMKSLEAIGLAPAFRHEFDPLNPAFDLILEKLGAHPPSTLILVAGPEPAARLVKELRHRDVAATLIGSPTLARNRFLQLAGDAADGLRVPVLKLPAPPDAAGRDFPRQFAAEYGQPPDDAARLTYDATRLLIEAIRAAGLNRVALQQFLQERPPWPGVAGLIRFDGTGQNNAHILVPGVVRNGRVERTE